MAIVHIDPAEWENANVVQIDSDSSNNAEAVIEIENWAHQHGLPAPTNTGCVRHAETAK